MKNIILLAGIAALAATAPAAAKPGKGKGNSHASMAQNGQGHFGRGTGFGAGGCPPGLAKKGCLPPGQARKRFNVGQRLPHGYDSYTPYNQIPYDVRSQYDLDPYGRYIYDQNYIYGVDPRTNAITQILNAILR